MIYKYCRRCGRRLVGEENRARGYGRVCYERAKRENEGKMPLLVSLSRVPIEVGAEQSEGEEQSAEQSEDAKGKVERAEQSKRKSKAKRKALDPLHLKRH